MLVVARRKSDQNRAAIDPWTAVHFGVGLGAGLMDLPFWPSMIAAVVYEVFEQGLERSDFGKDLFKTSGPENGYNVAVDIVIFAIGHWAGQRWNAT